MGVALIEWYIFCSINVCLFHFKYLFYLVHIYSYLNFINIFIKHVDIARIACYYNYRKEVRFVKRRSKRKSYKKDNDKDINLISNILILITAFVNLVIALISIVKR